MLVVLWLNVPFFFLSFFLSSLLFSSIDIFLFPEQFQQLTRHSTAYSTSIKEVSAILEKSWTKCIFYETWTSATLLKEFLWILFFTILAESLSDDNVGKQQCIFYMRDNY
jgi:hypothetical protein